MSRSSHAYASDNSSNNSSSSSSAVIGRFFVKLTDLGTALQLETDPDSAATDEVGTLGYMAPEISFPGRYALPADIFSFAVVMWQVFAHNRSNPLTDPKVFDGYVNVS